VTPERLSPSWYWTWKVRHGKAGRPVAPKETRELIRTISQHNVLWGAPRIAWPHINGANIATGGFRFDLASVLGREEGMFQKSASFFDAISQHPVLNRVTLIAEPWDLGTYQVGNFPVDWSEWNGRFRDTLRKFVKGDAGQLSDLGTD
jgi:hypothetical protein